MCICFYADDAVYVLAMVTDTASAMVTDTASLTQSLIPQTDNLCTWDKTALLDPMAFIQNKLALLAGAKLFSPQRTGVVLTCHCAAGTPGA